MSCDNKCEKCDCQLGSKDDSVDAMLRALESDLLSYADSEGETMREDWLAEHRRVTHIREQYVKQHKKLVAELAQHRADLKAAAGELAVPIPEPGTVVAKLLRANSLLRGLVRSPEEARVVFWYEQYQASSRDHAATLRELEELRRVSGGAEGGERRAYTRAVALIAALKEEAGPGRVLHGALQAAIIAEANAIDACGKLPKS